MEESDRRAAIDHTEVEFAVEHCDDLNENDAEQDEGDEDDLYESEEEDAD